MKIFESSELYFSFFYSLKMALEIHAREIVLGMLWWYEHHYELLILSIYL